MRAAKVLALLLSFVCVASGAGIIVQSGPKLFVEASSEVSACTVNFLDSLSYTKPACYAVDVPDEDSVANKYYVDMTSGSGSTCSEASPCASLTSVSGKTGTSGGPAYIYLKGNGYLNLTSSQLAGADGTEIVVKPWPSDSTPAVMTAAAGCDVANANTIAGANTHHVIFDGGPDMLFRFVGSGCTTSQNGYTLVVKSDDITMWRVRVNANGSSGPALGPATSATTANFKWINSEIYGATRYYGVYTGGGASCDQSVGDNTSHTGMEFRNSIFREIDGRGIQIEPRATSSGVIVDGNAFHDVGYNDSASSSISGAVQPASACLPSGHSITDITITNNLMWDLGGGGVVLQIFVPADDDLYIENNTIWDYANSSDTATANSHGISCSDSGGCNGTVHSNIVLAPAQGGLDPLRYATEWSSNDNVCESGSSCGSNSITGTAAAIFDSVSTSSSTFLHPNGNALNACVILADAELDYLAADRGTVAGATDCGAINEP